MRGFAVLGLALMLAAFAPPDTPDDAQQSSPKSWIPEPREKKPPAVFHLIPEEAPAPKPVLPDTCANGYVAPKVARPADLPPGATAMTPEQMFEKACATKPPEKPDRQFVSCPTQHEITRVELAKVLSDAYWYIGNSVFGDALTAIEQAAALAENPEEKHAVALAREKRANARGDRVAEIEAMEEQLGTGCLSAFRAGILRSTIEYMRSRSR